KLRAGLDGRLTSRSGRGRLTLVREYSAQTPEAAHPPDLIVRRLGLGRHLAQLCDSSGQIATLRLHQPQPQAACTRVGTIADRIGEIASFFGGRARGERVTRNCGALRLEGEDLAQPPLVAYRASQADGLGEVRLGHLAIVVVGDYPAGG